ncbi:AAA family ATPase [Owenweeksia hongkongensis]|uniref:AAA family ATPase n=1 Tax=Owenweeksia hongkongensis TaxID=253245 RepID=UPI003A8E381D
MLDSIIFSQNNKSLIGLSNAYLDNLGKINVFAGTNNSGKSRTLRSCFQLSQNHRIFSKKDTLSVTQNSSLIDQFIQVMNQFQRRVSGMNQNFDLISLRKAITNATPSKGISSYNSLKLLIQEYRQLANSLLLQENVPSSILEAINSIERNFPTLWDLMAATSPNKLYIPILRGLRPLETEDGKHFSSKNLYKLRTTSDYFSGDPSMFTGLSLFEEVRSHLLGDHSKRETIKQFEQFLGTELFQDQITLIPREGQDTLFVKIGNEEEKAIFNYGDGMQTLITILFPVFINRDVETAIFIEEPETHLHPSFQKKLIELLKNKMFDKVQYFITSHSPFIINDPDVKVYHFSKSEETFCFKEISNDSNRLRLMGDLGISPSDMLLSNFVLFVEGPSDKVYFEYLLKKYHNLEVRKHYNIFLMNGDNYRHLFLGDNSFDEIMQLNRNIAIVLDGDRSKKGDHYSSDKTILKKLAEENEIMCWITQKREIENYIPFDVYKEAVMTINPDRLKIKWDAGDFANRTNLYEEKKSTQVSPKVTLSGNVLSKINATKTHSLDGISDQELREAINAALIPKQEKFGVGKMNLAKKVTSMEPEFVDSELRSFLKNLAERIQKANT